MKKTIPVILVAIIALITGIFAQHIFNTNSQIENVSKSLMTAQLPDLSEKPHQLSAWQGKVLIINFWATWCPPCLNEIPEFIALQKQYADKNVQFIGIAIDEKQPVIDYHANANINYPILIAGDAGVDISKQWGNAISSIPFTVIVNSQGQIVHRQLGEISREELLQVINPLIR